MHSNSTILKYYRYAMSRDIPLGKAVRMFVRVGFPAWNQNKLFNVLLEERNFSNILPLKIIILYVSLFPTSKNKKLYVFLLFEKLVYG